MMTETIQQVDASSVATDILSKCEYDIDVLHVGITDATTSIVKFKFYEDVENPIYLAKHIRSYTNVNCLNLYKALLRKGVNNYGILYLGEENPNNLRTLFVVYRTGNK